MCVAALAVPLFAQASVSGRWRLTLQTDPVETLDHRAFLARGQHAADAELDERLQRLEL